MRRDRSVDAGNIGNENDENEKETEMKEAM
jgi:hypothetical protein